MKFYKVILFLLPLNVNVDGQVNLCQNTDNLACQCKTLEGVIDISSIGKKDGIQYSAKPTKYLPDSYTYDYNPCYPFNKGTKCIGSAACQWNTNDMFNIGTQSSVKWSKCNPPDQDLNCITYTATTDGKERTTVVVLTCGNTDQNTYIVDGEYPADSAKYTFRLTSKCACPGGCGAPAGGGDSGLSTGSIMCITFSVLFVVYVAAGITFNVTKRGAKGMEVLPNAEFWKDFPALVKDGTVFFIGLFKKGGYQTMD